MLSRTLAPLALVACTSSTPHGPTLAPEVQRGPAADARPARVLVLHAACGSVERKCPKSYIDAVDAIVRGNLEFAGYRVIEAETLFAHTRQRHEEHTTDTTTTDSHTTTHVERTFAPDERITRDAHSTTTRDASVVVLDGSTFYDLAIDERRELLAKVDADGVLSVRIVVGGQMGVWMPNQTVEVMVKLGVNEGDTMAWASRCAASSNQFATVDAALEHAARCAVFGGTGR
jgi:hypothetical protein